MGAIAQGLSPKSNPTENAHLAGSDPAVSDYHRPLSRMELDSTKAGEIVADAILKFLKTGEFPSGVAVGPKWIDGETMGEVE